MGKQIQKQANEESSASQVRGRRLECRLLGGHLWIHENTLFRGLFVETDCIVNHREVCPTCGAYRVVDHEPFLMAWRDKCFDTSIHPGPDGRIFDYWAREDHMAWRDKYLAK